MGLFDIDPQLLRGLDMNRAAQNPGFKQKLMGLLGGDPDDPQAQGLLAIGASLLEASGPSTMPTTFGQALGKGLQGYQQARTSAQRYKDAKSMQKDEMDFKRQALQMELGKKDLTSSQKDLLAAGFVPGTPEWSSALRAHVMGPQLNAIATDRRHEQDMLSRKEEKIDRNVTDLSKRLADIAPLRVSISELNKHLSGFSPDEGVPGVGYGTTIPGAQFIMSPEGKKTRSLIQGVANDLLKLYSGGAVTPQEHERRMVEMMASGSYTAKDLYQALPLLVNRINDMTGNTLAGYDDEVRKIYSSRPGSIKLDPLVPTQGKKKKQNGGIQFLGFE